MAKKKGAKGKSNNASGPSASAIIYTGPIRAPVTGTPNDLVCVRMSYLTGVNGGSVGAQTYFSAANVASSTDWSSYSAVYDEYRVLGYELEYLPNYGDGNSSVVHSYGIVSSTHNPNNPGPFTSPNVMIGAADYKRVHTGKSFVYPWKMASTEESQFFSTGSVSSNQQGWVNLWFPNATSSGQYGALVITFVVQYRGRK